MPLMSNQFEKIVLAGLIHSRLNAQKHLSQISVDDFEEAKAKSLFRLIRYANDQHIKLDHSIADKLGKSINVEVDGMYLVDVTSTDHSNFSSAIAVLKSHSAKKHLTKLIMDAASYLSDPDKTVSSTVSFIIEEAKKINSGDSSRIKKIGDVVDDVAKQVKDIQSGEIKLKSLTGINAIDKYVKISNGELISIAAGSGIGKSWLANNIAGHHSRTYGASVLIFSMEMTNLQVTQRYMSLDGINSMDLREGKVDVDGEAFKEVSRKLKSENVFIYDRAKITIGELERVATEMKYDTGLDLVVIDHGLLMDFGSSRSNDADKIGEVSGRIKSLSKELQVNTVLLWQMTKESRKGKPNGGQMRSSGRVYEDSDVVIVLDRPETKGWQEITLSNGNEVPSKNIAIAMIDKNRWGLSSQEALMKFAPEQGGYVSYDPLYNQ